MRTVIGIVAAVVLICVIVVIVSYNSLVKSRQRTRNAWSQVEILLQRRFDLIPNLVEVVKGYTKHESGTMEEIAQLRTSWASARTIGEKCEAENKMSGVLKTAMGVFETYPELKANQNFLALQKELGETESKIAYARQFFNDSVTRYNTKLETFPSNLFAKMFGFREEILFSAESEEAKKNINVKF